MLAFPKIPLAFRGAFVALSEMDVLDVVQGAARCRVVPLFSPGSLRRESTTGVKGVLDSLIRSSTEMKHKQRQPKNYEHESEKD
jgi:hypothetical protein